MQTYNNSIQFLREVKDVWEALSTYNDILKLGSIKEINDRLDLINIVNEIINEYIEKKQDN